MQCRRALALGYLDTFPDWRQPWKRTDVPKAQKLLKVVKAVKFLWWKAALTEVEEGKVVWQKVGSTKKWIASIHHLLEEFSEQLFVQESPLSVTTRRQWSATALTPKLLNIFSLSAITSPFSPPLADSLISHLKQRGQKYNIINLLPLPQAALPNYHPLPWKPFGWVSNHSNLHLRCLKTCSPWRRRRCTHRMEMGLDVLCAHICMNRVCRHFM